MAADVGNATAVVFGTSSFTSDLLALDLGPMTRESVRTTHLGTTTAETFMPADIHDSGELQMSIAHDPNEQPPIDGVAETITITWPKPAGGAAAATAAFSGFITSYSMRATVNERMEADITIKITADITFTDSS